MNISDYRRDFAAYNSALELAYYEHRAGFEPELHIEPVYERYGELFTRDRIEQLKLALAETPAHLETERDGLAALYSSACIGYLEAEAKALTDERARCEAAARVEWEGQSLPVHNAPKLIANESQSARRRDLSARWSDALIVCDDLRAARFESFHESARSLGFASYRALFTEVIGTDYEQLAVSADAFLVQTERAYNSALAELTARDLPDVPQGELEYADFFFFQRMRRLDAFFPADEALATYTAAMRGLGIRVEQQTNILIDNESRPFKNPRAACFRIHPPDDVRLLLSPVGGSYDYTTLFHEAGHAQHFGWTSRELATRYPEFVYAPDQATSEGYAFLLSHLCLDADWISEYRGDLSPTQTQAIARDLALLTTHQIRRLCAKLKYDILLHDSQNVRSDQLAASYSTLLTEATGFRRGPMLYLLDVDDGFYAAAYLRALAFEASLREYLRTRYGRRWWANRQAGDELIDLWNTASRYTVEELARLIGFGAPSFELLAETLIAALNEA